MTFVFHFSRPMSQPPTPPLQWIRFGLKGYVYDLFVRNRSISMVVWSLIVPVSVKVAVCTRKYRARLSTGSSIRRNGSVVFFLCCCWSCPLRPADAPAPRAARLPQAPSLPALEPVHGASRWVLPSRCSPFAQCPADPLFLTAATGEQGATNATCGPLLETALSIATEPGGESDHATWHRETVAHAVTQ